MHRALPLGVAVAVGAAERTAEEDNEALEARLAERTAELNSSVESLSVRSAQQVPPRTRRVVANFW